MKIIFAPTGSLDVSTDPGKLPEKADTNSVSSGAMTRCTNLHLDNPGMASTRRGSAKLNSFPTDTNITRIIEQAGKRYTFSGSYIYEDEVQIDSTRTAGTTWTATWYNPYNSTTENIYAINGTDRVRIEGGTVYEWGIESPVSAPTISEGSLTGITGTYQYVITYCRKEGSTVVSESNPSDPGSITVSDKDVDIEWVASSDPQVTAVRIYRSVAGGSEYYHVADVNIGTTTYNDTMADDALGTEVETDHDRPPLGDIVIGPSFTGQLFILKDNNLYYCRPNRPDYWPPEYYTEISPATWPLKAGAIYDGQVYLASKSEIYQMQGTGATSYFPLPMGAITGTQSKECFSAVKGVGIFHLGADGIYQYTGGKDYRVPGFTPVWEGETKGSLPGLDTTYLSRCWMRAWHNKLYFGYVGVGNTYPKDVIVWDLVTNQARHYQYGTGYVYLARDRTNHYLLTADTSGYVWSLEDVNVSTDNGASISWQIESKEFSPFQKMFPRYARYDVTLGTGATANGYILMNGTSKQTHTLTTSRANKKRLITGCTGDRVAIRLSGTGPVDIYKAMVE